MSTRAPKPGELPARLRVTADLVAEGLSNRAIAEREGVSPDAIKNRIVRLYDTLGFVNDGTIHQRVMVARWAWEQRRHA